MKYTSMLANLTICYCLNRVFLEIEAGTIAPVCNLKLSKVYIYNSITNATIRKNVNAIPDNLLFSNRRTTRLAKFLSDLGISPFKIVNHITLRL